MRAIVPQIAMSAGTMIACSCASIVMGKHSSLGPIDPQFGNIAAANLLSEVMKAREQIIEDPRNAMFWNPILSRITPSFIERCELAITDSNEFLDRTLRENMLASLDPSDLRTAMAKITEVFANNGGKAHNTHISAAACAETGLVVENLENEPEFQDLVLTLHHCYMHTLANTPAFKIVENHLGRALVKVGPAGGPIPMAQMVPFGTTMPSQDGPAEMRSTAEDEAVIQPNQA